MFKGGYIKIRDLETENYFDVKKSIDDINEQRTLKGKNIYKYRCLNGNHRLFLLKHIYDNKKINVLIDI